MANIMICVTGQMECERLIHYALDLQKGEEGELYLVHVSAEEKKNFTDSIEALQHLYDQAVKNGASLNVLKSKSVLDTLEQFVSDHKIDFVIMGETREKLVENSMTEKLQKRLLKHHLSATIRTVGKEVE